MQPGRLLFSFFFSLCLTHTHWESESLTSHIPEAHKEEGGGSKGQERDNSSAEVEKKRGDRWDNQEEEEVEDEGLIEKWKGGGGEGG